jgi:hypothetical protein
MEEHCPGEQRCSASSSENLLWFPLGHSTHRAHSKPDERKTALLGEIAAMPIER